ncbi:unnamed protein product [Pedinophyceae sp. YPF-701]|nr:unnamed protein product [Pedinophyceae sp. YPF-701]
MSASSGSCLLGPRLCTDRACGGGSVHGTHSVRVSSVSLRQPNCRGPTSMIRARPWSGATRFKSTTRTPVVLAHRRGGPSDVPAGESIVENDGSRRDGAETGGSRLASAEAKSLGGATSGDTSTGDSERGRMGRGRRRQTKERQPPPQAPRRQRSRGQSPHSKEQRSIPGTQLDAPDRPVRTAQRTARTRQQLETNHRIGQVRGPLSTMRWAPPPSTKPKSPYFVIDERPTQPNLPAPDTMDARATGDVRSAEALRKHFTDVEGGGHRPRSTVAQLADKATRGAERLEESSAGASGLRSRSAGRVADAQRSHRKFGAHQNHAGDGCRPAQRQRGNPKDQQQGSSLPAGRECAGGAEDVDAADADQNSAPLSRHALEVRDGIQWSQEWLVLAEHARFNVRPRQSARAPRRITEISEKSRGTKEVADISRSAALLAFRDGLPAAHDRVVALLTALMVKQPEGAALIAEAATAGGHAALSRWYEECQSVTAGHTSTDGLTWPPAAEDAGNVLRRVLRPVHAVPGPLDPAHVEAVCDFLVSNAGLSLSDLGPLISCCPEIVASDVQGQLLPTVRVLLDSPMRPRDVANVALGCPETLLMDVGDLQRNVEEIRRAARRAARLGLASRISARVRDFDVCDLDDEAAEEACLRAVEAAMRTLPRALPDLFASDCAAMFSHLDRIAKVEHELRPGAAGPAAWRVMDFLLSQPWAPHAARAAPAAVCVLELLDGFVPTQRGGSPCHEALVDRFPPKGVFELRTSVGLGEDESGAFTDAETDDELIESAAGLRGARSAAAETFGPLSERSHTRSTELPRGAAVRAHPPLPVSQAHADWAAALGISGDDLLVRFVWDAALLRAPAARAVAVLNALRDARVPVDELMTRVLRRPQLLKVLRSRPDTLLPKVHFLTGAAHMSPEIVARYPAILTRSLTDTIAPRIHFLMLNAPEMFEGEEWRSGNPVWLRRVIEERESSFPENFTTKLGEEYVVFKSQWSSTVGVQMMTIVRSGQSSNNAMRALIRAPMLRDGGRSTLKRTKASPALRSGGSFPGLLPAGRRASEGFTSDAGAGTRADDRDWPDASRVPSSHVSNDRDDEGRAADERPPKAEQLESAEGSSTAPSRASRGKKRPASSLPWQEARDSK